jgi:hypothetical protein
MHEYRYLAAVALLLVASQSTAETVSPDQGPAPLSASFPCDAFVKNPDGSWTPTRVVNIVMPNGGEVLTVGPAASFHPGRTIRGLDVAAFLEQQCPRR